MGVMIDGKWTQQDLVRNDSSGRFVRRDSIFRNWITSNGAPGPSGEPGFKAEKGRYHLYVSYSCPWAHRTLIFRALKGLEGMIDVSATHWRMLENGWTFEQGEGVARVRAVAIRRRQVGGRLGQIGELVTDLVAGFIRVDRGEERSPDADHAGIPAVAFATLRSPPGEGHRLDAGAVRSIHLVATAVGRVVCGKVEVVAERHLRPWIRAVESAHIILDDLRAQFGAVGAPEFPAVLFVTGREVQRASVLQEGVRAGVTLDRKSVV